MTTNHICACRECEPKMFEIPEERLGEAHVGVRFGDFKAEVYIGDRRVSQECWEAMAGLGGWAFLYSHHGDESDTSLYICGSCGHNACGYVYFGDDIRIEQVL